MAFWTLRGELEGEDSAVLIDSVVMRPFPFVFASGDEADAFVEWWRHQDRLFLYPESSPGEMAAAVKLFRRATHRLCDSCDHLRKNGWSLCADHVAAHEKAMSRRQRMRDDAAAYGDHLNDEAKGRGA